MNPEELVQAPRNQHTRGLHRDMSLKYLAKLLNYGKPEFILLNFTGTLGLALGLSPENSGGRKSNSKSSKSIRNRSQQARNREILQGLGFFDHRIKSSIQVR